MIIFTEFLSYIIERYIFSDTKSEEKMNFFRSLRKNFNKTSYAINRIDIGDNTKLGGNDASFSHLWPHWLKWNSPVEGCPSSIKSQPVFKINNYQFHLVRDKLILSKKILEQENFKFHKISENNDHDSEMLKPVGENIHLFIKLDLVNYELSKPCYFLQLDKYMKKLATKDEKYMICICEDDVNFIKLCSQMAKFNDFYISYNTVISNITTFTLQDDIEPDRENVVTEISEDIKKGPSSHLHKVLADQSNISFLGNNLKSIPLQTEDQLHMKEKVINFPNIAEKPPNILIYTGSNEDSTKSYINTHSLLSQCLSRGRYAVYHLKRNQVASTPWMENNMLLILAANKIKKNDVGNSFLNYFLNGGVVISLTCNFDEFFLNKVKPPNQIVDITSVVRFKYKKWNEVAVVGRCDGYDDVIPSDLEGISFIPLAQDSESQHQMIVLANHKHSSGIALLSRVNFEKDPSDITTSTEEFVELKQSNPARIEVFRSLLTYLGLDCTQADLPPLSPVVLFGVEEEKITKFIKTIKTEMKNDLYTSRGNSYRFVTSKDYFNINTNDDKVPTSIIIDSKNIKSKFNFDIYKQNLRTKILGNVVFYAEVLPTTMTLLDNYMLQMPPDIGLIAITTIQTSGLGRGGNVWLGPEGCGMFSLHLQLPIGSALGQHVSCIQHLTALAMVLTIREKKGYEDIDLRIKWPNDVYFAQKLKLGGILVRSTIVQDVIHINLGCGINISNKDPTTCINDLIVQHNKSLPRESEHLFLFTVEEFLGRLVTQIERLINSFQSDGGDLFFELYYKYWLHNDQLVTLNSVDGPEGLVIGVTKFGFLSVRLEDGTVVEVHPDGNSFDMMKNLIAPKIQN